jgi:lipopolysaccharide/colanic/teichoic acid biosynthesis glycosyltransferase
MAVNHQNQTREEYRKTIEVEKKQEEVVHPKKEQIRVRFFPIWLRLVLLVVSVFIFLMVGAAVGYGVIGNGKALDVFKPATWTHIRDLVDKK